MADFIAGYISGSIALLVGNPLDVLKTRLQASSSSSSSTTPTSISTHAHTTNSYNRTTAPSSSLAEATTNAPRSWATSRIWYHDALRGLAAPVVTYGALNAVLFTAYNRSLMLLQPGTGLGGFSGGGAIGGGLQEGEAGAMSLVQEMQGRYPYWTHFAAGCIAGLATFVVSAPTEVVKCRAQVLREGSGINIGTAGTASSPSAASATRPAAAAAAGAMSATSSLSVAKQLWRDTGIKGFYHGGIVTALRDSIGYGFYYLSYELAKDGWDRAFTSKGIDVGTYDDGQKGARGSAMNAAKILLCGGLAGVVTWTSVFPLDVVKTRVQTQDLVVLQLQRQQQRQQNRQVSSAEATPLLSKARGQRSLGAWEIAKQAYRNEGVGVFFRGLGVCCARAFVVNAVQWAVYEWVMDAMVAKP